LKLNLSFDPDFVFQMRRKQSIMDHPFSSLFAVAS
jgi:hypothetical protein